MTVVALTVAVSAVSTSGALIAYAAAPALAIAMWRNVLAAGVLIPAIGLRRRTELSALGRGWLWCLLSGIALAVHFGTWVPSVKMTTVATATALAATQPIWAAGIALMQGRRLGTGTWLGIAIAVIGAVIATGADFSQGGGAFRGDLLAIAAGAAAAVYTSFGEHARAKISTTTYTGIVYSVCGLLLLAVCLAFGVQLTGFDSNTWLAILALTAGAQLLGHSLFNYALQKVSAVTVSVLILLEVPVAALLGWAWLGQAPRPSAWPGLILLTVGVAVVTLSSPLPNALPSVDDQYLTGDVAGGR